MVLLTYMWMVPVAEWLRTPIFRALNHSSSHRYGFKPSSGHMWDKPCSACRRSGGFSQGSLIFTPPKDGLRMSEIILTGSKIQIKKNPHMLSSSGTRFPFLCLKLPVVPSIMWANSKGCGETAQMCRLAWAFAVLLCDKTFFLLSAHPLKHLLKRTVGSCLFCFLSFYTLIFSILFELN